MIPAALESQILQNIAETKAQAVLSACFERINQRTETEAKVREDSKLEKARYWWQEKE